MQSSNFISFSRVLSAAVVAAVLCPHASFAATKPTGCPEGYIWLETTDGNAGTAGNLGFDHSSLTVESTTGHWSDGLPPSSDKDYFVGKNSSGGTVELATPNNNSVAAGYVYHFGGRSLMMYNGHLKCCHKGTSIVDLGENVTLIGSCVCNFPAMNTGHPTLRAKATIQDNGGFVFDQGTSGLNKPCYFEWALTGSASTTVTFQDNLGKTAIWYWCGDCSAYNGKLCLKAGTATTADNNSTLVISNVTTAGSVEIQQYNSLQLLGANAEVKGKVTVQNLGVFDVVAGTSKIGSLDLQGELNFTAATSKLQVGGDITIGGSAKIVLPAGVDGDILTFPSSAAFSLAGFQAAVERCETNPEVLLEIFDNGTTKTLTVMKLSSVANRTFDITGDGVMTALDATYRVNVKDGASLTMRSTAETRMAVNAEEGAEVVLAMDDVAWQSLPSIWLDASAENSISNVVITYEKSTYNQVTNPKLWLKIGETFFDENGNPFIKGWLDCRETQKSIKLWNCRYDAVWSGLNAVMYGTHPRRVKDGFNGKDYIACDRPTPKARVVFSDGSAEVYSAAPANMSRIYFTSYGSPVTAENNLGQKPRFAFFVFGSQNGGGGSLLGGNANFLRGGTVGSHKKDDPIFASNSKGAEVWLDGTKVDPTTTGFDGDWQVVTVDFKSTDNVFSGLGYGSANDVDNGGQNYAEIILFNQDLSEKQRQAIEIYLAEKWGIADKYAYPGWAKERRFATVYGKGTVTLGADAKLGGAFKGTVNLNGNNLTIDGAALPPGTNALDTTGLEGWYDPDAEGKTREQGPTKLSVTVKETGEVIANGYTIQPELQMIDLLDVVRPKVEGSLHIYGQPQRAPWLNKTARAYGPARKWMEFSNLATVDQTIYNKVSDGKVLRFSKVDKKGDLDGSTYQQPMQTLFMVQDSVYGGGHPFADGETVNSPVLYKSRTSSKSAIGQPIYPAGTADILTKGITCLDGREVNGLTESFGARPEVLTVVPTETFNVVAIGQLGNSENITNGHNEVIGEIMIYNRKLEAAERKVVEAYLAYKWLGIANEGYSALSDATVVGAGTVTAASAALLPKFGAGFTGTVSVPIPEGGFAFTLKGSEVEGALDFGGGTFTASGEIKVTVSVEGTRQAGSFKLIGWGTQPAGATFDLVTDIPEKYRTLRVEDDGLWLDVRKAGTVLIIK